MTDEPDDDDFDLPEFPDLEGLTAEDSLWAIAAYLERFPPELVREGILNSGVIPAALDALKRNATSDDPKVRQEARDAIEEMQLGPLLADELSDDDPL